MNVQKTPLVGVVVLEHSLGDNILVLATTLPLTHHQQHKEPFVCQANEPEIVAASCQDDPVRREALPLHDEGDIAVLLAQHQLSQLLRQQVDVVDLRHRGQRTQGVAVAHGRRGRHGHI